MKCILRDLNGFSKVIEAPENTRIWHETDKSRLNKMIGYSNDVNVIQICEKTFRFRCFVNQIDYINNISQEYALFEEQL